MYARGTVVDDVPDEASVRILGCSEPSLPRDDDADNDDELGEIEASANPMRPLVVGSDKDSDIAWLSSLPRVLCCMSVTRTFLILFPFRRRTAEPSGCRCMCDLSSVVAPVAAATAAAVVVVAAAAAAEMFAPW